MARMGDVATIYSPRPDEPTEATFRGCADGEGVDVAVERCGPGSRGLRAKIAWPDLSVICEVAIDDVGGQVASLLAYAREMSTDPADPLPSRIQASQQVLALRVEPGFDDEGRAEALLSGLLRERDGVVLRGGRVLDGQGACLLAPPAPEACEDLQPPSALRVARRALVLCAVVCRASLEQEPSEERAEELQERLVAWLEANDLDGELEEHERELIEAPVGSLPRQRAIDASWRSEGLAVLGWALGGYELPPHDEQADPQEIAQALGFLEDDPACGLDDPRLRDDEELERLARRLMCLHWRLREFTSRPGSIDLAKTAGLAFTAAIDLGGVPMLEGDLALRGAPIAACEPDVVTECASIAFERHQAINWLAGHHDVYSEVDTST